MQNVPFLVSRADYIYYSVCSVLELLSDAIAQNSDSELVSVRTVKGSNGQRRNKKRTNIFPIYFQFLLPITDST